MATDEEHQRDALAGGHLLDLVGIATVADDHRARLRLDVVAQVAVAVVDHELAAGEVGAELQDDGVLVVRVAVGIQVPADERAGLHPVHLHAPDVEGVVAHQLAEQAHHVVVADARDDQLRQRMVDHRGTVAVGHETGHVEVVLLVGVADQDLLPRQGRVGQDLVHQFPVLLVVERVAGGDIGAAVGCQALGDLGNLSIHGVSCVIRR
ncbi:hypothetical protein PA7078_04075 [Pseudomonas aeruginosa]